MKIIRWVIPILAVLMIFGTSCKKDGFNSDGALTFSTDTVIFDTVFTTIGSVTRQFRIYNPSSDEVTISSIMLARGSQSKYRMNVDGVPGIAFSNISIPGKDSLFVFVDVTLDPNNFNDPAIVTDSVVFSTNGIIQDVDLVAFGWDANFTYPTEYIGGIGAISFLDCDEVWGSDQPHVIYGWAVVPAGCSLTIQAGTKVYSHKNSGIIVDEGGTLIVDGDLGNEVTFASDRLDDFYEDQAGEWNGIWIFNGSSANHIEYALIKNGTVGITLQPWNAVENNQSPVLTLHNTVIENMSAVGLIALNADIEAYNCIFGNAGQHSLAIAMGGSYDFKHCTFGNYWIHGNRQTPAILMSNWLDAEPVFVSDLDATFGNCIIDGNNINELALDRNPAAQFNFTFDHCLLKIDFNAEIPIDISNPNEFKDVIYNQKAYFADPTEHDFQLDSTLSAAYNVGSMTITNSNPGILGADVIGNQRPFGAGLPDLGAYELQQ